MRVCGALAELFGRADLVFLQQSEDLRACCALRQHDAHGRAGAAALRHAADKGMIVIVIGQLIGSRVHAARGMRKLAVELEKPRVLDEAVVVQHVGDGIERGILRHGDLNGIARAAEGQHIRRAGPGGIPGPDGDDGDDHHIEDDLHEQRHDALVALAGRLRRELLLGLRLLEFAVVVERMAEIRRKIVRLRRPRFGGLLRPVRRFVQLGARFGQDLVDGPAVAAMFLSHGMPPPRSRRPAQRCVQPFPRRTAPRRAPARRQRHFRRRGP